MAAKKKPVRRRKSVARRETTVLDQRAICLHEWYLSLRRAGFSVEVAMGMMDKSYLPDWVVPPVSDTDITPFYDDDEDED